jgi:hypothetical protein
MSRRQPAAIPGRWRPGAAYQFKARCTAYGIDANFWSEKEFGPRVCAWLLRTFESDPSSATVLVTVEDDLLKSACGHL